MDHDVPLGYRDLTDVDRNLIECAVFDTLIAAHAVQPPVDVDAFEAAVEDYCEARSTFSARTVFFGHGATRDDYEEQIAEALDAKRAAHQRLIRMYRERGL